MLLLKVDKRYFYIKNKENSVSLYEIDASSYKYLLGEAEDIGIFSVGRNGVECTPVIFDGVEFKEHGYH